jgi:hypothetical protein
MSFMVDYYGQWAVFPWHERSSGAMSSWAIKWRRQ